MTWEETRKPSRLDDSVGGPRRASQSSKRMPDRWPRDRAVSDEAAPLSVVAIDLKGDKCPGLSVDYSPGGISLFFGRHTAPHYRAGEIVNLCMRSPLLARPLVAPSWVCRAETTDWGRMYTFRFVDPMKILSQVPPELAGLFTERSDRRVLLDSDHPVEIRIDGLPPVSWEQVFSEQTGFLVDLSSRGLSFRVDADIGRQLLECKSVEVAFALLEGKEKLSFWVQILHCVPDLGSFFCSAVFDEDRTEDFFEKQQKLVAALRRNFSADLSVSEKSSGPVRNDYILMWAAN